MSADVTDHSPGIRRTFLTLAPPGGEPAELAAAIGKLSPLSYVDAVTASVWLLQGEHDPRTAPTQARNYADALRAAGGDVVIECFDAGHEPVGLDGHLQAQRRLLELVEAALDGCRWDQREV